MYTFPEHIARPTLPTTADLDRKTTCLAAAHTLTDSIVALARGQFSLKEIVGGDRNSCHRGGGDGVA
jgi:hypothetical protein